MALKHLLLASLLGASVPELTTTVEPEPNETAAPPAAAEELTPPRPLTALEVPMPEDAKPPEQAILVRILLSIDEEGEVVDVSLLQGAGEPWDSAVLEAARRFRFEPARLGGRPVAVEIPYEHRFLPAPKEEGEELSVQLRGRVVEMGTLRPVAGALIEVAVGERSFQTYSEADGGFEIWTLPGEATVEAVVTGYRRFFVREKLQPGEALEVRFLVERERYDPYETTVVGRPMRDEVFRTTLRDREIRQVPGTFGDPFRVVGTLPGVTQVMSLLSYPIVRGSNPAATGILIDGIRVPQLFHYMAGPAVIHPAFIDRVDFYAGNFPVDYGGYTGGIIDGITRPAARDERAVDLGIDLTNTSLFLRQPVFGSNATVAGRYGYPGLVLGAFTDELVVNYWDYQARLDGGSAGSNWTVFAFGAHDEAGEPGATVVSNFHRLDLRYRERAGRGHDLYRISFGTDWLGTSEGGMRTFRIDPRASWERPLSDKVTLRLGTDLAWRHTATPFKGRVSEDLADARPVFDFLSLGAYSDLAFWVGEDLLITPGFRLDAYEATPVRQASFDPRLLARYRIWEDSVDEFWLKAGVGLYSQPPRFPIPIPGLEEIALDKGLGRSVQASLGAEYELRDGFSLDVQGFFSQMDPVFFEVEALASQEPPKPGEEPDEEDPTDEIDEAIDQMLVRRGRALGLEVLLRKRGPGPFFGWISYTLSRTERQGASGWYLYEYDRTHILNAVLGIQLPRNWELGWRIQVQDGIPSKTGRLAPFTRLDLRIDRRVVYRGWMLDFYIDVINVMVSPEPIDNSETAPPVRYLLPSVGFRAVL